MLYSTCLLIIPLGEDSARKMETPSYPSPLSLSPGPSPLAPLPWPLSPGPSPEERGADAEASGLRLINFLNFFPNHLSWQGQYQKNEKFFLSLSPNPSPRERGSGAEAPGLTAY